MTDRAPRRRHAAAASRILVGGASVAATLGLSAHWAAAAPVVEVATVSAPVAPVPAQRVVILRRIIREVAPTPAPSVTTGPAPTPVEATPAAPAPAPAAAPPAPPAPEAVPALPSAALVPPPAVAAPAPATSSQGS